MQLFKYSRQTTENWKANPIRIQGPEASHCCSAPTLLTQSMKGGFVTSNCIECQKSTNLKNEQWQTLNIWVACPNCSLRMVPDVSRHTDKNYSYVCLNCNIYIWLADLLPNWDDLVTAKARVKTRIPEDKKEYDSLPDELLYNGSSSEEEPILKEPLILGVRNLRSRKWFVCLNDEGENLELLNPVGKRLPRPDTKLFSGQEWVPISCFDGAQITKFEEFEAKEYEKFNNQQMSRFFNFSQLEDGEKMFVSLTNLVERLSLAINERNIEDEKKIFFPRLEKIKEILSCKRIPMNTDLNTLAEIMTLLKDEEV